jgi:hypothetical protein
VGICLNNLSQVMCAGSTVSRGTLLQRLFTVCYLAAVAVAMFGWLSAFGWLTFRALRWLMG